MDVGKYVRDFETSVDALPGQFSNWDDLPAVIRETFFDEMIGMLARRTAAERLALQENRGEFAERLSRAYEKLLDYVDSYGQDAGFSTSDFT